MACAFEGSVLVGPCIEYGKSCAASGAYYIRSQRQIIPATTVARKPTALLVNSGESNPVNNEVLTVIDTGATSEGGFGWSVT
jgi:hypothetical protein